VAPPSEWQQVQIPQQQGPTSQGTPLSPGATAPSAHIVSLPTHASQQRPMGTPTLNTPQPSIAVVSAPPLHKGAPYWLVAVIGLVCLGLGFAAGMLAGAR
jgi:hypothetical protein